MNKKKYLLILSLIMVLSISLNCFAKPENIFEEGGALEHDNGFEVSFNTDNFGVDDQEYLHYKGYASFNDDVVDMSRTGYFFWLYDSTMSECEERNYRLFCCDSVLEPNIDVSNYRSSFELKGSVPFAVDFSCSDVVKGWLTRLNEHKIVKSGNYFDFMYNGYTKNCIKFKSNLPLFDINDPEWINNVNAYINSNGTIYTGASNEAQLDGLLGGYSKTIDFPHEFRSSGCLISWTGTIFNFDDKETVSCSWKVPDEKKYNYEVQIRAKIPLLKPFAWSKQDYKWTDWKDVSSGNYEGYTDDRMKVSISTDAFYKFFKSDILNLYTETAGHSFDVEQIEFRVRHTYQKKYSRWVDSYVSSAGTSNTYLTDDDGDAVENDEYDGSDTTDPSSSGGGNVGITGLVSFVRNGFGLTGTNGLIAMFSHFVSFLPPEVTTIILMGVALMVIIAVIKWVRSIV